MLLKFKKDPYFLQKYYLISFVFLLFGVALIGSLYSYTAYENILYWLPICFLFCSTSFSSIVLSLLISCALCFYTGQSFSLSSVLILTFVGFYIGIWANVLIHNASHGSIRPKRLNRIVGELVGVQLLSGFPGFALIHMQHHRHSDDLEHDPHPNPPGMGFWQYINETRAQIRKSFAKLYNETWGEKGDYSTSWKIARPFIPLNRALRAMLLLMILGPVYFTFCFIVSHITTQLAFGVINYYSHTRKDDNTIEIINLDHNLIFKILNRCFSGAFYHKNHHKRPNLFNPMKLKKS